jgi:hypothetical protein
MHQELELYVLLAQRTPCEVGGGGPAGRSAEMEIFSYSYARRRCGLKTTPITHAVF